TYGLVPGGASADKLDLRMIGYRPRRRAVVRLAVRAGGPVFYVKVLRERSFRDVRLRHELLTRHGVPACLLYTS
ncbi:MAG TPA: phosphotransferase, partial [Propionibacteriaceae bacterium]|nr:phosphotransferase [Propionibacteriaceae bacterium]